MSRSVASIRERIASDAGLQALQELFEGHQAGQSVDSAHDLHHCHRVAHWTLRLDPSLDEREAIAGALLHDLVNLPKNSPKRSQASSLSAAIAAEVLPKHGFDEDAVGRICDAVLNHSFSRGQIPETALGKALQDADRLEALGAIGIFRTASTGARMGARYFDAIDPWAKSRDLDDHAFSVDHFFTKLLKLAETLNTAAGREEAKRRSALMRRFLEHLGEELGEAMP